MIPQKGDCIPRRKRFSFSFKDFHFLSFGETEKEENRLEWRWVSSQKLTKRERLFCSHMCSLVFSFLDVDFGDCRLSLRHNAWQVY